MEFDLKKKVIIGCFIAAVLLISGYLYYEYINSSSDNSINIENNSEQKELKSGLEKNLASNEKDIKGDNIIIIHIAGAVKKPRNYKDKRRLKVIWSNWNGRR